jgi:diguanylate cyclase (GGDEF)-like protein
VPVRLREAAGTGTAGAERSVAGKRRNLVSADQITYVLIALIVTGVAILLLLVGALLGRRASGAARSARPAGDESAAPAATAATQPPAPVAAVPVVAEAGPAPGAEPPFPPPGEPEPAEEVGAVTAADLEAAARRVHDPREEEIIEGFLSISPRRREAPFEGAREPSVAAPPAPAIAGPAAPAAPGSAASAGGDGTPADPYLDDATGLGSRAAWDLVLAEENARYVRYRRPVGVVVAELDGLSRFDGQFGPEASRRVLAAVGGALRRNARRTDRVAHVGGGRYLVMLPETDEIQAINYVERVRAECERWLEAGAVALHLSIGWASPSAVGELDTALRTAEERMYAERRRAARAGAGSPDA